MIALFLLPAQLKAQTLIIGSDETTSYDFPLATCMGFNYSQQIYTSDEMIDAGATGPVLITKISFMASPWNSSSSANYKDWVVYMGHTGVSGFTTASSWVPFASLTEVFNGALPGTIDAGEWVELTLTTPFFWDGESNVVVAVDENTAGWYCSQDWVAYFTPETRSMVYNNDGTNPDPASPPASTWMDAMAPYIKFDYEDAEACEDVAFAVGTISGSDVCPDVAFAVVNSGTMLATGVTREWQQRVPSGTGEWVTIEGVGSINYTNTDGITEATDYRCIVTCDATGETDTTNEITIDLTPVAECYCEPVLAWGCDWEVTINDVFTAGAVTDFSNMSTGCTGGYEDYSEDYEASAVQFFYVYGKCDDHQY
ncbi:MAG: hypothetical protein KL787_05265 [Taibaiella sp.]|nr:hypothetical protein [Taibaiella sp.]